MQFLCHEIDEKFDDENVDEKDDEIYEENVDEKMRKLMRKMLMRKMMTLQKTQKVGSFFPLRLIGLLPRNPGDPTINQSMSSKSLLSKNIFKN